MPYQTLRLTGGANTSETQALNEAGISSSQFVRFKPDPKGAILVEKVGGWTNFCLGSIFNAVRAMLAWEDTNAQKWFAYGAYSQTPKNKLLRAFQCLTNASGITTASGVNYDLTPQFLSDSTPVIFKTTAGSSIVSITDNVVTGLSFYDSVFISTPVSVGGIVLFGQYAITTASGPTYTISAINLLGSPAYASYTTISSPLTVTGGAYAAGPPATLTLNFGALGSPPFIVGENVNITGIDPSTWNGSCIVTACTNASVTVAAPPDASGAWVSGGSISNYGSVPVLSATSGSATITVTFPDHGYLVGDTFTVLNQTYAGSVPIYGNYIVTSVPNAYTFTITAASSSTSTAQNWLNALAVIGGTSTLTDVTLTIGESSYQLPGRAITGGSSTLTDVTLTWSSSTPYTYVVGQSVYVKGVTPNTWNGTFTVTGATSTSVTYSLAGAVLSWVSGGTITSPPFNLGAQVAVSGVTPTAWNGVFTVTNSTPTTVTYSLAGSALSWASGGVVSDIGGDVDLVYNITVGPQITDSGWGVGGWGVGGWGTGTTPTQTSGAKIFASTWSLDNWGEDLIACPVGFTPIDFATGTYLSYGPLYVWQPTLQQPYLSVITNGPPASNGFFVAMPQRQIVAWGTTFNGIIDPLLIRWCDVSNYNVWIGQSTNQAGSYRLSTGSAIIGAMQTMHQGLLWTDISLWAMQYIGPPYVYSFNQIGQNCGLIARNAAGVMNGIVYWMGSRQFYTYSENGVQTLVCPVWDVVFQNLDLGNVSKIVIAVNSLFQELTWYYPVAGGNGENSAYVRFNALTNMWDIGTQSRSAWIDNSILGPPIGSDPSQLAIFQHEVSPDANGSAISASFTTGYFAISEGQYKYFIDEIWPDFKWGYYNQSQTASIQITFNAVDFPGQTPTTYGPYTVTQATEWFNPRIRTRLLSMTVSSSDVGSFWRTGALRYRVQPDGRY